MGLISWYPFTKNNKNYGGPETFSVAPQAIGTGGPLGGFVSFRRNSSINFRRNLHNYSISFYFSIDADAVISSSFDIFLASAVKTEIFKIDFKPGDSGLIQEHSIQFTIKKKTGYLLFGTESIELGEWYHVVFICQNLNNLKVYINNKFFRSVEMDERSTDTFELGGQLASPLKFCDFRIYDNCLDENDIARIYRGSALDIVATEKHGGIIYDNSGYLRFFPISSPNNMPSIVANNMVFTNNIINLSSAETDSKILSVWFKPDWINNEQEVIFANPNNKMAIILDTKHYDISFSTSILYNKSNLITISPSDDFINIIRDYKSGEVFVNGSEIHPINGNILISDIKKNIVIGGYNNNSYFIGKIKKITAYNNLDTNDIPLLYESEKKMLTEIESFYSASTTLQYLEFGAKQFVNLSGWGPNLDKVASIEIDIEFDIDAKALSHECCLITTYAGGLFLWLHGDWVFIFDNQITVKYENFGEYYRARFNLIINFHQNSIRLQQYIGNDVHIYDFNILPYQAVEILNSLNLSGIVLGNTELGSFDGKLYYVNIIFYDDSLNAIFHKNFTPMEENGHLGLTDSVIFYPLNSV